MIKIFLEKNYCDLSYKINNIYNLNSFKTGDHKENIEIEKDFEIKNMFLTNKSSYRCIIKTYK